MFLILITPHILKSCLLSFLKNMKIIFSNKLIQAMKVYILFFFLKNNKNENKLKSPFSQAIIDWGIDIEMSTVFKSKRMGFKSVH